MSARGGARRIVAIGGGHGQAATLRAARRLSDDVTAVVTVADDGGSSGRLRSLVESLSPGDLRKCLVALADPDSLLTRAFTRRFAEGELAGHVLGNLLLLELMEAAGDPVAGLEEAARLLGATGRVLPAAAEPVILKAATASGSVSGQVAVMACDAIQRIEFVPPDPRVPGEVVEAIERADLVVIGPGSLFTSVLAAAALPAIAAAIGRTRATRVYVCNLAASEHETEGFTVADHLAMLATHGVEPDVTLCDDSRIELGAPSGEVRLVRLAKENGLAHDPERLAAALAAV